MPAPKAATDVVASIVSILGTEASALSALAASIAAHGAEWEKACNLIRENCGDGQAGRLVVTGVGKAGLIARKVSATFASTGTPSLYLHPTDARHGDLGMIQEADIVLAFSNSGATEEIVALLPSLKRIGVKLIAVVGRADTTLAQHADLLLSYGKVTEACPLGLAPSTSTTVMMALGDALALTIQQQRNFTSEHYARYHPGGALGRKLMTCVEAMRSGDRVATVGPDVSIMDALPAITAARAGSILIVDEKRKLLGIFTDGDLRRVLLKSPDPAAVLRTPVREFASMPCISIRGDELLESALRLCAQKKFDELPVIDRKGVLLGLLDLQDLVNRNFVLP